MKITHALVVKLVDTKDLKQFEFFLLENIDNKFQQTIR